MESRAPSRMFSLVLFLCNAGLINTDVAFKLEEMRHLDKLGDLLIPTAFWQENPLLFQWKNPPGLLDPEEGYGIAVACINLFWFLSP